MFWQWRWPPTFLPCLRNTTNFWHTQTKGTPNGDKATARYKLFKHHEFHKIVADEAARVYVSLREPSAAARSYLFMESHRNVGASLLRGHTDSIKQKMDLHTNEDMSAAKHWIEYACPCCQFTFEMLADRRSTAQIIASLGLSGYVSEAAVVAEVTRLTENRLHNRPSSQLADQNPETADIVQKHVAGPIYQKHQQWSARHSLLPSQAASNKISSLQSRKEWWGSVKSCWIFSAFFSLYFVNVRVSGMENGQFHDVIDDSNKNRYDTRSSPRGS